jgi:hypothetical protein
VYKGNFVVLKNLSSSVRFRDGFGEGLLFWVWHEAARDFDPFLQLTIAIGNDSIAFIDHILLRICLLVQMRNFCGEIGD